MKKLMIILFGMLFLISFISATTDISENLMNTTGNVTALYYCNSTNSCHTITDLLTDTDTTYTAGSNLTLTNTTFTLNTISVTEWLNSVYLAIGDAFSGAYADLTGKPTVLSNFTDDLGNRGYTSLSNFTNDENYLTNGTMNKTVACTDIVGSPDSDFCTDEDSGTPNIFDQNLNTTADVEFNKVNSSDWTNVSIVESQISDLQSYLIVESDPKAYNGTLAYNVSGIIKNWNESGLIIGWNSTGLIINWNSSGYIINWNSTGLIKDWNGEIVSANTTLYNWIISQNYLTSYSEVDPSWTGNFTLFNNSWSSTYNSTYNLWAYNQTTPAINTILGFSYYNYSNPQTEKDNLAYNGTLAYNVSSIIKDWNSTGLIQNWNASGWIKNWAIDIGLANTTLYNWVVAQGYVETEVDPVYDAENGTIARTGNCPAGQVVMNTTTNGVQCVTPTAVEVDPLAYNGTLAYLSNVFTKAQVLAFNYYNSTIFDINDYRLNSWDNLTGIPHATPSNGDTTHFSLADEIYDWVMGLDYTSISTVVASIGNWSADKGSYATTSYADSLGNFSAWDKDYNDLINKPTFTNDTWVDTYFPRFTEIVGLVGNWTADKPNYSNTTQMNTAIETANTSMKGYVDNQGFLTSETDLLAYNGTLALNSSLSNYYLISNPFSFYNSTTIPSYILTTNEGNLNVNSSNYWNNYNTPSGFLWTAGFNATGDTRWLTSYTEADPLWTDNSTLVGYLASNNQWTANQNLTNKNMTDVSCIKFTNGASWCGV
ncbi:MAG: hypothetical protein KKB88_01200 [Nanoarchaeota archaeon]|nr:hypothetical protein [Nanoarchaeota archaeon]